MFFVNGRPVLVIASRREFPRVPVIVDTFDETIDPAIAQGFIQCVVVGDARLTRMFLRKQKPDFTDRSVVAGKPMAPGLLVFAINGVGHAVDYSPNAPIARNFLYRQEMRSSGFTLVSSCSWRSSTPARHFAIPAGSFWAPPSGS